MKIEILCIAKNKDRYIDEGVAELIKKTQIHTDLNIVYLKESPITHQDTEKIKTEEGQRIIEKFKPGYQKIALDVLGRELNSQQFAKLIEKNRDEQGSRIQFIIGGPLGLSAEVVKACDLSVSFSKMTFTHQMIRLLLLEQIYRAFEIIKGSGYHK